MDNKISQSKSNNSNSHIYLKTSRDPALINLFIQDLTVDKTPSYSNKIETTSTDSIQNSNITALTVTHQYALLDPRIVYSVKKSIKLSIRSFLLSLSLTFLNFFI